MNSSRASFGVDAGSRVLRQLVQRATRRLVYPRRLPPPFEASTVLVSPSAGLRFLLRPMSATDPTLFRLVADLVEPGMVVWDVGANQGLFAFAAAVAATAKGKVFAVEPDAWLQQLLRRTLLMQGAESAPVDVIPAAISSEVGLRTFCLARKSRATSFLDGYGTSQAEGVSERLTVVCLTIDWLATRIPPPQVLKIDVEGAELEVLEGARRTLTEHRPKIVCEVSGQNAKAVTKLLEEHRYTLYDGERASRDAPIKTATWNTVALPQRIEASSLR